jgi:putative nucleotidyltransferase with HDIG domain
MQGSSKGFSIYMGIVIGAGWLVLIYLTWNIPLGWGILREILFWASLAVVVEFFPIGLPRGGGFVTLGFPIIYAAILSSGPVVAAWATVCGAFLGVGLSKRLALYKVFFNAAQLVLSVSAAWVIYRQMGGVLITSGSLAPFLAVVASALTYFLVNTFSVSTAIGFQEKTSPLDMWLLNFKWSVPNYLAQTPVGFLMALIYKWISWWAVLFFLFPLFIAYYAYRLYMDMRRQHLSTIQALAAVVEARDPYTEKHSERMAEYAASTARELGLSISLAEVIRYAAILHDIGKIGIDDKILSKRSGLTPEEWAKIRKHPGIGKDILTQINSLNKASQLIYSHHERYDGKGYPGKLKGEDIPIGARVLAVIDAYDAMTSKRPYRPAHSAKEAIDELKEKAGTQFDGKVVEAFLKVLNRHVA